MRQLSIGHPPLYIHYTMHFMSGQEKNQEKIEKLLDIQEKQEYNIIESRNS